MRTAVAECRRVDDAKDIANKALALQRYARESNDPELEGWVADIRLRALRRVGEISKGLDHDRGPIRSANGTNTKKSVLEEAGISRAAAFRAEKIAGVPAKEFERILAEQLARQKPVTVDDVVKYAAKQAKQDKPKSRAADHGDRCCQVSDLVALAATGIKMGTIYADPAWNYGNQATRASTGDHYTGMSVDEICALPISPLAADSAHLHLWTTNAFLFEAKRVMEAWGFEYRSCYIWVKPQMGMGNYWRVSHEFLLLGIRGSAPFADRSLMSWGQFPRRKHSSKPEEIRKLIEKASAGPRLELFARRESPGWYVWGNEIERAVFDAAMEVAV